MIWQSKARHALSHRSMFIARTAEAGAERCSLQPKQSALGAFLIRSLNARAFAGALLQRHGGYDRSGGSRGIEHRPERIRSANRHTETSHVGSTADNADI